MNVWETESHESCVGVRRQMKRPATFTEANAWVHLAPGSFTRHFASVRSVWKAEDGRIWLEAEDTPTFALWELAEQRTGEPMLPCGCWVGARFRFHARETLCMFSNRASGFRAVLRITGPLMLIASAPSRLHEAVCVHPHDEGTVEQYLEEALSDLRRRRLAWKGA